MSTVSAGNGNIKWRDYTRVSNQLFRSIAELTRAQLAVYLLLSRHAANETRRVEDRDQEAIARKAGCSVREVQRALRRLAELGLVTWESNSGRNVYTVPLKVCHAGDAHDATPTSPSDATPTSGNYTTLTSPQYLKTLKTKTPEKPKTLEAQDSLLKRSPKGTIPPSAIALRGAAPPHARATSNEASSLQSQKPQPVEDDQDRAARVYDLYLRSIEDAKYARLNTRPF